MQDWSYFLNVIGSLESTRISEDSLVSYSIETYSSVHHLLTERLSTCPLTNTEPCSIFLMFCLTIILNPLIALPCIYPQFDHKELRHLLLDQLPCVEVIEWWILTLVNNKDHWIPCVSMSIHCLCPIRIKSQPLVDDGFNIGLAFAASFPEAVSSSWIGMASLTYLSIQVTILIQDSVRSLNKGWTWTSILYLPSFLQTFMSETGPYRTLLWIHLIRVPFWSRGNVYSRHKDWFASPLGDGRA